MLQAITATVENQTMKALSRAAVGAPAALAVRGAIDRQTTDGSAPPARPILRAAILATAIGMLLFLVVQGLLALHNVELVRHAMRRGWLNGYPSNFSSLSRRLLLSSVGGGVAYLGFSLAGIAIAGRGHRLLLALPAASFVLVPVVLGSAPQAIGTQWQLECFTACTGPWFAHPWFGPLLDLALVLLPAIVVARRVPARRWPQARDPAAVASLLATIGLVALIGWTIGVIGSSVDVTALVAVGTFGIAVGTARPWWPWLHVVFAAVVAGSLVWFVTSIVLPYPGFSLWDVVRYEGEAAWPMILVALLASAWQPFAWLLRELDERPLHLLVAVNLLNVVDAVMTAVVVGSGGAVEANPLVRFGGLPAKVILVGVLTILLYRRRPSALVWPAAALLWVACYHVSGILVNGWRA